MSEDTHPTELALGTHNTLYYRYHPFGVSRFKDGFVRRHHRVTALVGGRGGGFIFDTNGLHRGRPDGAGNRTVVILEFQPLGKVPLLHNRSVPCPSSRRNGTWRRGVPGYPLYPVDEAW